MRSYYLPFIYISMEKLIVMPDCPIWLKSDFTGSDLKHVCLIFEAPKCIFCGKPLKDLRCSCFQYRKKLQRLLCSYHPKAVIEVVRNRRYLTLDSGNTHIQELSASECCLDLFLESRFVTGKQPGEISPAELDRENGRMSFYFRNIGGNKVYRYIVSGIKQHEMDLPRVQIKKVLKEIVFNAPDQDRGGCRIATKYEILAELNGREFLKKLSD